MCGSNMLKLIYELVGICKCNVKLIFECEATVTVSHPFLASLFASYIHSAIIIQGRSLVSCKIVRGVIAIKVIYI